MPRPHAQLAPLLVLASLVALVAASVASARVLSIEITRRAPLLEGRAFGARGAYELIEGRVRYGFDPASEANATITDLELAPRNANGLVEAEGDFLVLQPVDPELRSGTALVGVPNRGRRLELMMLNRAAFSFGADATLDPARETDWGDGFLMERGLTVMWVGWQGDVPPMPGAMGLRVPRARERDGRPVQGLARSDWVVDQPTTRLELAVLGHLPNPAAAPDDPRNELTRRRGREAAREGVDRASWRFAEDRRAIESDAGFEPGWIFELVYVAEDPPVIGLGFAAYRDFVSFARNDPTSPFPIERAIADGSSQSGRFLRHLLYEGFDRDEAGRGVLDGVIIRIAGAGRGGFDHRFGHPGRVGNPYESFFYPGDEFPFTSRPTRDGDRKAGLFDRMMEGRKAEGSGRLAQLVGRGTRWAPKVFQIDTGYEYWGRAASLVHTTPDGRADVPPHPNERLYHIASAPHMSLPFPPDPRSEVAPGLFRGSSVDTTGINRALLRHMQRWVEQGEPPPDSTIPTIAAGTLVEARSLVWPIAGLATPRSPHVAYHLDFGPRWSQGIVDRQPPVRGAAYGTRVPSLDALGSEATGIRPLELRVPIGTYLPWALRTGMPGGQDEMIGYLGSFLPLPSDEASRRPGDERPAFATLYPDRAHYEAAVSEAIDGMVEAGWLLPRDRAHAFQAAIERWEWMVGRNALGDE
ncbi:MAG: hypothetical protein KC616_17685 [Myxococcales bacterium]|nr:hypothetical protein [Myxococcales bacterium]